MKTVISGFSFFSLLSIAIFSQAADWPECRRAKLESIKLQDALRKGRLVRGYSGRNAMRGAMRDYDKWLWRECRQYSGELRDLAAK